jgi:pimeloyl-ACP methyl ester carboxylesterase
MTTLLALAGAFGDPNNMAPLFQGKVAARGTFVPVTYRNSDVWGWTFRGGTRLEYIEDGVAKLDAALHSTPGPWIMFGHSLGALVGQHWIAKRGPTSSIPPEDLEFVFGGNSIHRFGGRNSVKPDHAAVVEAVKASPYKVLDIVRQWEYWADAPLNTASQYHADAVKNVKAGDSSPYNLHVAYGGVDPDPDSPGNTKHVEGNWTYVWNRTNDIPLFYNGWNRLCYGMSSQAAADTIWRPRLEAAHARPVPLP